MLISGPMRHGWSDAGEVELSGEISHGLNILHNSNVEGTISFREFKTMHLFNLKMHPLNSHQFPLKEVHYQGKKAEAAAPPANQTCLEFEGHGSKNSSGIFLN